jgi:hypothetical protein
MAIAAVIVGALLTPATGGLLLMVSNSGGVQGWFLLLLSSMFFLSLLTFAKAIALVRDAQRLERTRTREQGENGEPAAENRGEPAVGIAERTLHEPSVEGPTFWENRP